MIKECDVTEKLKSLGYNVNDSDLVLIQFAINGAEQYIKNFCNITVIPPELYFVAVDIAAGTLLRTKSSVGENVCDNIDFNAGRISNISEGDTSVGYTYDNNNTSAASRYITLLDRLCNRDAELIAFRKLRW